MSAEDFRQRPLAAARVVSSVPGRLRLRLPEAVARRDRLVAAAEVLVGRAGVAGAEARWRTGSLVVEYDPGAVEDLWAALGELGLARSAASAVGPGGDVDSEGARVLGALARVNALVAARTGGSDLRALVPVGLGMLALRQFLRSDQRLAAAPWYVLAWYASETFQRFHVQRRGE